MPTMSSHARLKSEELDYKWILKARSEDNPVEVIDSGKGSLHQCCWCAEFAANDTQRKYPELTIVEIVIALQ